MIAIADDPHPYPPDWIVDTIEDRGPGEYYRFRVTGRNLNFAPDHPDHRFEWRIPTDPALFWRYVVTDAIRTVRPWYRGEVVL